MLPYSAKLSDLVARSRRGRSLDELLSIFIAGSYLRKAHDEQMRSSSLRLPACLRIAASLGAVVLFALQLAGCVGGSVRAAAFSATSPGPSTLTVTGTSSSVSRNHLLPLTVNWPANIPSLAIKADARPPRGVGMDGIIKSYGNHKFSGRFPGQNLLDFCYIRNEYSSNTDRLVGRDRPLSELALTHRPRLQDSE